MPNNLKASKPLLFFGLIAAAGLLALLPRLAAAQEAPGEFVPGAENERARPFAAPEKAPETGMSAEERKALDSLFEGHSPVPDGSKRAPAPTQTQAPEGTEPIFPTPDGAPPAGYRPSVPARPGSEEAPPAAADEAPAAVPDAESVPEGEQGEVVVPQQPVPAEAPAQPAAEEAPPPAAQAPAGPDIYMDMSRVAVIRLLNKQTTRSRTLEVAENNKLIHGTLEIALEECWHSAPSSASEAAALLHIFDTKPDTQKREAIFHGWVFSAYPSLNHLEHPVYDVTLVTCK